MMAVDGFIGAISPPASVHSQYTRRASAGRLCDATEVVDGIAVVGDTFFVLVQ